MPDASPPADAPLRADASPPVRPPLLADPWATRGALPLDRWAERRGLPPLLMALMALAAGWILFQAVGAVLLGAALAAQQVSMAQLSANFEQVMAAHIREVLLSNTAGQVLGLALLAVGLAWAHSSRWRAFLRLRRAPLALLGLSVLGLAALLPFVYWLGALNEMLPLPDWLRALEAQRTTVIEGVLRSDLNVVFILLTLAVTPAVCEELLFRGYVQRQFERGLGAALGIAATGLLFGAFHLSAAQLLPLSVLGLYLAYVTWRTGSVWTGVAVHFANNAFSVIGATWFGEEAETSIETLETVQVPWYIVLIGLAGFGLVVAGLQRLAPHLLRERRRDREEEESAPPASS